MQTVGQILKETRESKFYSLEEVEKSTKIRKELLMALEADDYANLPPATFVQGFIKNYAQFLNLDSQKLLAVFRREFSSKDHKPYVMESFSKPISKSKINLTPSKVLGLVVALIVFSFFGYLWVQYRHLVEEPTLVVISPQDEYTSDIATIVVEGKTDPEVKVLLNSQEIATSAEGTFKEEITLASSVNKISISAVSKLGKKTEVERVVYLKSGD